MRIKFCGLIFCTFDQQENLCGINICGHVGVVGTIVVGFAKYASYCESIFTWIKTYHEIHEILCTLKISIRTLFHVRG